MFVQHNFSLLLYAKQQVTRNKTFFSTTSSTATSSTNKTKPKSKYAIVDEQDANHYSNNTLASIKNALSNMNLSVTADPTSFNFVDQFHLGGVLATLQLLEQLNLRQTPHTLLDVGCGLGGSARLAATEYGCDVIGLDLTADYIATANFINKIPSVKAILNKSEVKHFVCDVTDMSSIISSSSVDSAMLIHVGMNICDKNKLASEIFRVLRPNGRLALFDIMLAPTASPSNLLFPLPFASCPSSAHVDTELVYTKAFTQNGFVLQSSYDKTSFCLDYIEKSSPPPTPLNLTMCMGSATKEKMRNVKKLLQSSVLVPIQQVYEKPP